MEHPNICQSCGMHMDDDTDYGTNLDKSPSYDYCNYCYKEGKYTFETKSVEEFADKMIEAMARQIGSPEMKKEEAVAMLQGLGRWKK